jgi:hypothetical protein
MPNPLSGARVKIVRAKKHLADLEGAIKDFDVLHPYSVMIDKKTEPGHEIHRFWQNVPIPSEWAAVFGDCVHNLRSALDLLAVALVKQGGATPTDYTAFPVGSDQTHFETSAIHRIDGASADAIKIVCELKPYRGGNDTIWRLHRLDIADKHQLLIPVAAAHKMFGVKYNITGPGMDHYGTPQMVRGPAVSRKFPLKNGDELGRYIPIPDAGYKDNTEFEFGFEIAFGEGQAFAGEALIPTLNELLRFTEGIADIFARRIFGLAGW